MNIFLYEIYILKLYLSDISVIFSFEKQILALGINNICDIISKQSLPGRELYLYLNIYSQLLQNLFCCLQDQRRKKRSKRREEDAEVMKEKQLLRAAANLNSWSAVESIQGKVLSHCQKQNIKNTQKIEKGRRFGVAATLRKSYTSGRSWAFNSILYVNFHNN